MLRCLRESKLALSCCDLLRLPARRNSILSYKNSELFGKRPGPVRTAAKWTSLNFSAVGARVFAGPEMRADEIIRRFNSTSNIKVNRSAHPGRQRLLVPL